MDIASLALFGHANPQKYLFTQGTPDEMRIPAYLQEFFSSAEFSQQSGSAGMPQLIDQMYVNLFGRHAEAEGLQWWLNTAQQNHFSQVDLLTEFLKGAQNNDARVQYAKQQVSYTLGQTLHYARSTDGQYRAESPAVRDAMRELLQNVQNDASASAATASDGAIAQLLTQFHFQASADAPIIPYHPQLTQHGTQGHASAALGHALSAQPGQNLTPATFHEAPELIGVTHANSTPGPF
ncbi:DUF4214 domain-containing protein [Massilia sp. W12]|uniref:DUF4214 domain-containing protein n=1 Tax=Massilia sp. W12 TaxID=3126507 RepID=UPI0030D32206